MIDKSCAILNEISIKASLSHSNALLNMSLALINHCINLNQLLFPTPIQIPIPIPIPREEDSRIMMKIKKRLV